MNSAGDLREINQAFKQATKSDPSVPHVDYLDARKAAVLEALAKA